MTIRFDPIEVALETLAAIVPAQIGRQFAL